MGCRKCAGRLLAIHSDHPQILRAATSLALEENISALSQARLHQSKKLAEAGSSAPSLLIETILEVSRLQEKARRRREPFSVTAYYLTNSGQSSATRKGPPMLTIYRLPLQLIRFLQTSRDPRYQEDWRRLSERGRKQANQRRKRTRPGSVPSEPMSEGRTGPTTYVRNLFYEHLLLLPQNSREFLQRYFLPGSDEIDSSLTPVIHWPFIALFLREVLSMERERIAAIEQLGDALAHYVQVFDDQRFLHAFYREDRSEAFRSILLRAARRVAARKEPPLLPLELFCTVFLSADGENLHFDWRFARDLLFLRMLEWLYEHDQANLEKRVQALPDEEED
jgi:CRISPR-associated protein Cst1